MVLSRHVLLQALLADGPKQHQLLRPMYDTATVFGAIFLS